METQPGHCGTSPGYKANEEETEQVSEHLETALSA